MPAPEEMMPVMREAAVAAGRLALALRENGLLAESKADDSPVTQADRAAEAIISEALAGHWPQIPVVAEEACAIALPDCDPDAPFFLVDPIDGTREYICGREEFTVNIALVTGRYPVAGVVYAPALDELFEGSPAGAFRRRGAEEAEAIRVRRAAGPIVALASRSHRTAQTNRFLEMLGPAEIVAMGSSLKFCRLAEGAADVYPCFGKTMEWDTAAAQAVLEAAGGAVVDAADARLSYGKGAGGRPDYRNPFFLARGNVTVRM
ncbi:3'(2'),5'-bisphosphate nucleotidase CysQ [Aureimonas mangrovi]|uniref:3'(2'),5'-bisphosphate nucleotidase CysQ n=1 Tax=Aureimonas mangrovi TaxID=2758041 RepID=UPI00163DD268|nr:3'(2'),5'-bisphosphate nucleotidase CysQ [Aureimonas mangrovi]